MGSSADVMVSGVFRVSEVEETGFTRVTEVAGFARDGWAKRGLARNGNHRFSSAFRQ